MTFDLAELGLLDGPKCAEFDNLTMLASRIIKVPISLISILDYPGQRQFFAS